MSLKYVQTNTLYLAGSGVIIGATSITITTLTDIYTNVLTMTSFGAKGYITLEPDTTNEEAATFTGITANANGTYTLTGVSSALAQSPYTESSGLVRQHSGGTKVVVTDNVAFWNTFANTQNTNTFSAIQTFSALPTIPLTPSASTDAASKGYVDTVAVAGAPNASTTVKGIVQEATQAQVLAKTASGSTGAELYVSPATLPDTLLSDYKVDTGSANAYAIAPTPAITAYTVGQIFSFKAVNASTTASTLNVNGLGVKTIKNSAAVDLVANDILAGQIVVVEYDGTNFQMISNSGILTAYGLKSATTVVSISAATAPSNTQVLTATSSTTATWQALPTSFKGIATKGTTTYNLATASGVQNIAHSLGFAPSSFRVMGNSPVGGIATSFGGNSLSNTDGSANTVGQGATTFTLHNGVGGTNQTAVITADATNIILTWTKTGAPTGTINIIWEAFV